MQWKNNIRKVLTLLDPFAVTPGRPEESELY